MAKRKKELNALIKGSDFIISGNEIEIEVPTGRKNECYVVTLSCTEYGILTIQYNNSSKEEINCV